MIREINHRYDPQFDSITYIDKTWKNNRSESEHAALMRLLGYRQKQRSAGARLFVQSKNRHVYYKEPGIQSEIALIQEVCGLAA